MRKIGIILAFFLAAFGARAQFNQTDTDVLYAYYWIIYQGDTLGVATISGDTLFLAKGADVDTLIVPAGAGYWQLRGSSDDTITAGYNVKQDSSFLMNYNGWYAGYLKDDIWDGNSDSLVLIGAKGYSDQYAYLAAIHGDSDTAYMTQIRVADGAAYTDLTQYATNFKITASDGSTVVVHGFYPDSTVLGGENIYMPDITSDGGKFQYLVGLDPNGRLFPQPLASGYDSIQKAIEADPTAYSTWVRDTTAQRLSPANANDKIIIGPGHENNYGVNQFMQGYFNIIDSVYYMDKYPYYSTAVGIGSRVYDWYGFASGAGAVAEGKISAAFNNHSLATVNDGTAEGNITVSGRMRFEAIAHDTITHPTVGQCSYVIIAWWWGDMTSLFPNLYTDNIETRYGTGANADARGNVNGAIHDTAVYNPDGTINTANDLTWAMHTYCYIKGVPEGDMERYKILYASHATTGDTIFYDSYPEPFSDIESIYSSYFAITADGKWNGGTGSHSEGWKTSAYGYGSHAEGLRTNAWGWSSHAQNYNTYATGWYSNSAGYHSWARRQGEDALANGYFSRVGDNQRSEYIYKDTKTTSGVLLTLTDIEDSTSYYVETMVHGVQTSTTTGSQGEMFAYKIEYCVTRLGSTYTTVGTPIRTLIGRNVSDSGDGLTTGERIAWYGRYSTSDDFGVAFYGSGNRTFRIVCRSIWTEIKY